MIDAALLRLIGIGVAVAAIVGAFVYAHHVVWQAGHDACEAEHRAAMAEKNRQIEQMNENATQAFDDLDRARGKVASGALGLPIADIDTACAMRASTPPNVRQQLNAIR